MSEQDEVVEILEQAGLKAEVIEGPYAETCERCGAQIQSLMLGGCFPCAMWEDPDSTEEELLRGTSAALSLGITLDMWVAGRKRWGKLVPTDEQVERIRTAIRKDIEERLQPWIKAHR